MQRVSRRLQFDCSPRGICGPHAKSCPYSSSEYLGRIPVCDHLLSTDEHGDDSVVVAVHHARKSAVLFDRTFGVFVQRAVEALGIDDRKVGAIANSQMAGVELVPVSAPRTADGSLARSSGTGCQPVQRPARV